MMTIDRSSPILIYLQIEQLLERMVFEGRLAAHEMLPGVVQLADELGVSPLTVQKAFRRLQDRGLIYSVAGKGTFVAEMKDRPFVAVVVQNQVLMESSHGQALPKLLQGIYDGVVAEGMLPRLLVDINVRQMRAAPLSAVVMDVLRRGRVQGIVTVGHYGSDELFELAAERSIPTVSWGNTSPRFSARADVTTEQVLQRSLEDMKQSGIEDAGVMWLDRPGNSESQRAASVQELSNMFAAYGMRAKLDWIMGIPEPSEWAGYHAFNHMWDQSSRPRGLIMLDEVFGRGVLMAMQAKGIRSPEDMRAMVASYEDSGVVFPAGWSRCEINLKECGAMVASLVRALADGKSVPPFTDVEVKWHGAVESKGPAAERRNNINLELVPRFRNGREVLETAGVDVPSGVEITVRPAARRARQKESVR